MAILKPLFKPLKKNCGLNMPTLKAICQKIEAKKYKEVLIILAHILKKDLSYIIAHPEYEVSHSNYIRIAVALDRLEKNWPLAYIIGEQYFYSRKFLVSQATLIPRPESEAMIDLVLVNSHQAKNQAIFLDIGTGTGALIISLAKELKEKRRREYELSTFLASDISLAALNIAKKNTRVHQVDQKINFYSGNLMEPILQDISTDINNDIFIMANLPYLTPLERNSEASIRLEPDLALLGGGDGLSLYYQLLIQLIPLLTLRRYYLIMEINPTQIKALKKMCKELYPEANINAKLDFRGQTRFLVLSNLLS